MIEDVIFASAVHTMMDRNHDDSAGESATRVATDVRRQNEFIQCDVEKHADISALGERDGVPLPFVDEFAERQHREHRERGREGHDRGEDVIRLADVSR